MEILSTRKWKNLSKLLSKLCLSTALNVTEHQDANMLRMNANKLMLSRYNLYHMHHLISEC